MPHRPEQNGKSDREINGQMHQSLRVLPQKRDPLAPKKHKVLIKDGDGYSIIKTTEEPIEMFSIQMQAMHAITWADKELAIIDEDDKLTHKFQDYKPAAWQEPDTEISAANKLVRDRWMLNIMQWLIPYEMAQKIGAPESQEEIRKTLKDMEIEVAVSPTGCGVVIYRSDAAFAAWRCDQ